MASRKSGSRGGGGKRIQPDEIIERLVSDPANPRVLRLTGRYLGNSSRPDHWRLYLTEALNHYLEFKKEDALDVERTSSGRMIVWLKSGTHVDETITGAVPSAFLMGDFRQHLRRNSWLSMGRRMFAAADGGDGTCLCPLKPLPPTQNPLDPLCRPGGQTIEPCDPSNPSS